VLHEGKSTNHEEVREPRQVLRQHAQHRGRAPDLRQRRPRGLRRAGHPQLPRIRARDDALAQRLL